MLSEKKNRVDFIYEEADMFRLTNWLIIILFNLSIVIFFVLLMELSVNLPRYTPIILPIILGVCGYLLFSRIYTARKLKLVEKYDKKELVIFFKRCKTFTHYKKSYFTIAAGIFFFVFHLYLKYVDYDTLFNGDVVKYGTITNLSTSNGRSISHTVDFSFKHNGQIKSGSSEIYKFYDNYRNNYGYPLSVGDEYAVISRKGSKSGSEICFKIPSQQTLRKISLNLMYEFPNDKNRIRKVGEHFGYKGLLAYYLWKNPDFLKKINGDSRSELKKIMEDDEFEFILKKYN